MEIKEIVISQKNDRFEIHSPTLGLLNRHGGCLIKDLDQQLGRLGYHAEWSDVQHAVKWLDSLSSLGKEKGIRLRLKWSQPKGALK